MYNQSESKQLEVFNISGIENNANANKFIDLTNKNRTALQQNSIIKWYKQIAEFYAWINLKSNANWNVKHGVDKERNIGQHRSR